jgi:hypothetical protein
VSFFFGSSGITWGISIAAFEEAGKKARELLEWNP